MSAWHGAAQPQQYDVSVPQAINDIEEWTNWAGFGITEYNGAFSQAEINFTQPYVGGSSCNSTEDSIWAGIGGWSGDDLAQAGTTWGQLDTNGRSFWEIVPSQSNLGNGAHPMNLIGHPGYNFYASVRRITGGYRFWVTNYYSNTTDAVDATGGSYDSYSGYSDEAIVEHPEYTLAGLTNFQTLNVNWAKANGSGFYNFADAGGANDSGRHNLWMYDSFGNKMVDTSSMGSGSGFQAYMHNCS